MLRDGLHDIPPGKVAMVVTHLEMTRPAPTRAVPVPDGWMLTRIQSPTRAWYRSVFTAVGSDWLWYGRMTMPDADLDAILSDPDVHVYTLQRDGADGALLELDFRGKGACELAYFGVTAPLIGTGAGRYLMNMAIDLAWSADISRFHVHTCTIDSPQALGFYQRSGFVPVRQQIEIADDPRIAHGYDRGLAPHIPVFDP
ncbi:GNAT family N-acetyltransferase [uncultured Tateyamaria sp.]|uniref:GNAT family N-acetyltransferase n=1 Tax=uncultured Tateyamaria sp. TaxID=455651 RepID=UPI002631BC3A|nr:GNAT family N-acetyltransferase [uncultured Tateyamaria sp.]